MSEPVPRPALRPSGAAPVRRTVYLHPGQLAACAEPTAVSVILGSCVAVCLWDRARRRGGVAHFLLPGNPEGQAPGPRFGDYAVRALLEKMAELGCAPDALEASLYGGARVSKLYSAGALAGLGDDNLSAARSALRAAGVRIVREDSGGNHGRALLFTTDDGRADVRPL